MKPTISTSNADLMRKTFVALSAGDQETLRTIFDDKILMEFAFALEGVPTSIEGIETLI